MRLLRPLLVLAVCSCTHAIAADELKAGAFAQDITPTHLPSPINGNMKGAMASTVNDPMHARCLAVSNGKEELILCVVDSCMIPREICETAKAMAAKDTGVPASHMLISATHSHTCATMTAVFQSDPDPAYLAELPARIAAGLATAHRNLEPAEIAWNKDSDPTQVFNRRWLLKPDQSVENPFGSKEDRALMNPGIQSPRVSEPSGPVDPEVCILAARSLGDHRPIAVLANYSLHYVGGLPAISADYYGVFANEIATRLKAGDARYAGKPAFVGIMSNGTSGNINNVNFGGPSTIRKKAPGEQIRAVATSVGDAAMRAWDKLSWKATAPLASAERDINLSVRKATAAEGKEAQRTLDNTAKDKDGQFSDRKAIYAREALLLGSYPDQVRCKLQAHRIGGLTIASIPCEVFVEIGLDLKKTMPLEEHFTISLANGYNGYLPTPEHHKLGGYETWRARSSYLEVDASTKITAQLKEMLKEVAK
ncbi:MAG: Neutral/alkaline non-lysosomal ceramidase [Verrucomicrobiaceae bacterium]|nr:Neutral/alkaline non-lysosomal ceramidase [Verrucomicrobiaceae bacterium]